MKSISFRKGFDIMQELPLRNLCLVHVIWTERQMSKLALNDKYLLLLSFLTAAEFYNLGHIQGIIRQARRKRVDWERGV